MMKTNKMSRISTKKDFLLGASEEKISCINLQINHLKGNQSFIKIRLWLGYFSMYTLYFQHRKSNPLFHKLTENAIPKVKIYRRFLFYFGLFISVSIFVSWISRKFYYTKGLPLCLSTKKLVCKYSLIYFLIYIIIQISKVIHSCSKWKSKANRTYSCLIWVCT